MTRKHCSVACVLALAGVFAALGCAVVQGQWHTETVNGVSVRVRKPANWNRMLVVAAGGYSPAPLTFRADEFVPRLAQELLNQGYAYAETGYSAGGLAIAEAVADVRALRRRFIETHGLPERSFVIGQSKGGLVALLLMESLPPEFDGAVAISGLLASPYDFLERAHHLLVAFHSRLPSVLPGPEQVPSSYVADERTIGRVLATLRTNPAAASSLRELASVRRDEDLAELVAFHTDAMRDLQTRCSGNPFAPASTVGAADTLSASNVSACARGIPAPTGRLERPLLALDTEYDPVIPGWAAAAYTAYSGRLAGNRCLPGNSSQRRVTST